MDFLKDWENSTILEELNAEDNKRVAQINYINEDKETFLEIKKMLFKKYNRNFKNIEVGRLFLALARTHLAE